MSAPDDMGGRVNPWDCEHCGLPSTPEGHDACLGTLPGVMNACCGHGDPSCAYVQYWHKEYDQDPNRYLIRGQEALDAIAAMRREPSAEPTRSESKTQTGVVIDGLSYGHRPGHAVQDTGDCADWCRACKLEREDRASAPTLGIAPPANPCSRTTVDGVCTVCGKKRPAKADK